MSASTANKPIFNTRGHSVDSEGTLIPIEYKKSGAISEFIMKAETMFAHFPEYAGFTPEFKFTKLDVYGSVKDPYFSLKYVFKYMDPPMHNKKRFYGNFRHVTGMDAKKQPIHGEYIKDYAEKYNVKIFQKKKDGVYDYQKQIDVVLLSELGLMKAMFMENNEFTRIFQKLILRFIKNVREHHRNVYNQELKRSYDEVCAERNELSKNNFVLDGRNKVLSSARDFFVHPELHGDDINKEMQTVYYMHYTPVSVYIVHYDYVIDLYTKEKKKRAVEREREIEREKISKRTRRVITNKKKASSDKEIVKSTFGEHDMSEDDADEEMNDNESISSRHSSQTLGLISTYNDESMEKDEPYEDLMVDKYVNPFSGLNIHDSITSGEADDFMYYYIDTFDATRASKNIKKVKSTTRRPKYITNILENSTQLFDIQFYNKEHYVDMLDLLLKDVEKTKIINNRRIEKIKAEQALPAKKSRLQSRSGTYDMDIHPDDELDDMSPYADYKISETLIPKVYRTSLTHIMSARNSTLIDKYKPDFRKMHKSVKYSASRHLEKPAE
jgi:hypothetical protein